MTKSPRCVICGSSLEIKAFAAVERGFEILICAQCRLGRTSPPLPPHKIIDYYPESYYGKENVRFNPVFEAMTRIFQSRRARVLNKHVARGPVLDVGCGRGFLLNYLRQAGYAPQGVEFSGTAAWHARNRLKLDVITKDFLSARFDTKFNAIIFWHALEHFPSPEKTVAQAAEWLKPGGLLAVAVPNLESLQARFFGRYWFHLDIPRHYFHFGRKSLDYLLARHKFRVVQCDHFCFEQNPYGWLQSFYNILGFENNLLYSLLKHSSARAHKIRKYLFQTAAIIALLPLLLPLSLVLTLLEAALRRGGTIEVYAIKE